MSARRWRHASVLALALLVSAPCRAGAQDAAASPPASGTDTTAGGASESSSPPEDAATAPAPNLNQANNPLANIVAVNFQNYYAPRLSEVPDATSNTMWLRAVLPYARLIPRLSIPLRMQNPASGETITGLGDLNVFVSVVVTPDDSPVTFGIGPLYVAPSATNQALGTGTHQLGLASVLVWMHGPVMAGFLLTSQSSVTDRDSARASDALVFQYFFMLQLGQGLYARSAPIMAFDLQDGNYTIPFGLGLGKVFVQGNTVFNVFLEPTYTIASKGAGVPVFQLFAGLNVQFLTGDRRH